MAESISQSHLFSVALDFGTTYSGLAYSSRADFQKRPGDVHAFTQWNAGRQGLISEKTPTCLLLTADKRFEAFGYEAENKYADLALKNLHQDRYYFRQFKMKLHGNERIKEDFLIEDVSGKTLPAMLVFSLSIKYLKDKFFQISQKQGFKLKEEDVMWTLTVPAIWSESAKSFMRKAGVEATIKNEHLKLALEPEAASLHCQHVPIERTEAGISVADIGSKYMIIDLGGGTVDITVHEKLSDGKLKEIHKASGGPWGGTAIDDGFIELLTRIVGRSVMKKFCEKHIGDYLDLMRDFEISKRALNPEDDSSFHVKVPAVLREICEEETGENWLSLVSSRNSRSEDEFRVLYDKLIIDRGLMIEIFENDEKKIIGHIKELLQLPEVRDIDFILLVGGFAESLMVEHLIKRELKSEGRRIIIPDECGLSVVKGAVIFGHRPSAIESRKVRFTYGFGTMVDFKSDIHPQSKKYININGETKCRNIYKSFVTAGTSVKTGEKISHNLTLADKTQSWLTLYYTEATDVMYTDDTRVHQLFAKHFADFLPEHTHNNQPFEYIFSFGETEVEVTIYFPEMNYTYNVPYRFKLE